MAVINLRRAGLRPRLRGKQDRGRRVTWSPAGPSKSRGRDRYFFCSFLCPLAGGLDHGKNRGTQCRRLRLAVAAGILQSVLASICDRLRFADLASDTLVARARLLPRNLAASRSGHPQRCPSVGCGVIPGGAGGGIFISRILAVHSHQRRRLLARGADNFGADGSRAHLQSRLDRSQSVHSWRVRADRMSSLTAHWRPMDANRTARRLGLGRNLLLRRPRQRTYGQRASAARELSWSCVAYGSAVWRGGWLAQRRAVPDLVVPVHKMAARSEVSAGCGKKIWRLDQSPQI